MVKSHRLVSRITSRSSVRSKHNYHSISYEILVGSEILLLLESSKFKYIMYYVVTEGRNCGIYNSQAEIKTSARSISTNNIKVFNDRILAENYYNKNVNLGNHQNSSLSLPGRDIVEIKVDLKNNNCSYHIIVTRANGKQEITRGETDAGLSSINMTILLLVDRHLENNQNPTIFVIKDQGFITMLEDAPTWIKTMNVTKFTAVLERVITASKDRNVKFTTRNPVSCYIAEATLPFDNINKVYRDLMSK